MRTLIAAIVEVVGPFPEPEQSSLGRNSMITRSRFIALASIVGILMIAAAVPAVAGDLDEDAEAALQALYESTPEAKALGASARGILVFPNIVKAGFMVGAQYGQGALLRNGNPTGYYSIKAASYGFQAGIQGFGYALFFMTDAALEFLGKTGGLEVGVGPSLVVVDQGMARTLTSATVRSDVYAFTFGQKGLMAGAGLQGSKITRITP